ACILARQDYLAAATANGRFLLDSMMADDRLKHTCKDGQAKIDGYLDDYAMVIDGFLSLHQATFTGEWLRQAMRLAEIMIEQFWDETQATFYDTGHHHQDLFLRPRSSFDGALPSGASAATLALLKLARLTDNERFQQVATQALSSMRELMPHSPLGFGNWLCALDLYLSTPKEVAIIGPRDNPAAAELLHTLCATFLPNKVVAAYDPTDPTAISDLALLSNRPMVNGMPTVYICQQYTCQAPVTDPTALTAQLQDE
ncbi:MAG: thioredoxin domain-containing protein, partial [Chloroflexi bacterium]|nr:thioredoxin domain-containing protein [Chloroflexota bacterium]